MEKNNLNIKTLILINIILAQSIIIALSGIVGYYSFNNFIAVPQKWMVTFTLATSIPLSAVGIFLVREIYLLSQKETEAEINAMRLKESQELINVLRASRHDFMNHIQVIYGMAQLGKLENLRFYIDNLNYDMAMQSDLGNIKTPELSALLLKKMSSASAKKIKFALDIRTDLAHLDIPVTDLIRIVGNIIDNAVFSLNETESLRKIVSVTITENGDRYIFSIANNGPPIPGNIRENIFENGFTTKGSRGSGLGLAICKELVEINGGTISLTEKKGFNVCFEIELPKRVKGLSLAG